MPFGSLLAYLLFIIFPWVSATDGYQGWDAEPDGPLICPVRLSHPPLRIESERFTQSFPCFTALFLGLNATPATLLGKALCSSAGVLLPQRGKEKRPCVALRDLKCLDWCKKEFCNKSQEMYFWKTKAPLRVPSRTNFNNHLTKSPKLNFRLKTS